MMPIDDRTFDALEWADVDCAGLPLIMAGKKILGSEPITPDGFILYLEGSDGKRSVLEVTCSMITGKISLFCAEVPKRKEASI